MTNVYARIRESDGALVRAHADGREEELPRAPVLPMTDSDIEAAAASDPDNPPLTDADFERMARVPWARTLRRAFGLTQEAFAARFHIPLGTLRDWEQGRSEPDQPARAYLEVIARDPDAVDRALNLKPSGRRD